MPKRSEDGDPGGASSLSKSNNGDSAKKNSFLKKLKSRTSRFLRITPSISLEEEVAELIEEHDPEGTQIGSEERSIVHNVLGISDVKVSDVMIPRTDIIATDHAITLKSLRALLIKEEHTRIPIYKGSLDKVIGFVHIKDLIPLLGGDKEFNIDDILRTILYVPPSMKLLDLLVRMRDNRVHVALVIDEYGGTDGLVTMEDIMEEIVGEIEDEHDEVEGEDIIALGSGVFEVNARADVKELEEQVGLSLRKKDEDYDTVGGLLFLMLGRVPDKGEVVSHPSGVEFRILEADPRLIKKVRVKKAI